LPGLNSTQLYGLARQALSPSSARKLERSTDGPFDPQCEALTLAILRGCFVECQRHDWPVILVTQGLLESECNSMRQLCDEFGAELLRISSKSEAPANYFRIDGHWNTAGQRFVGELVAERILHELYPNQSSSTQRKPLKGSQSG
jgi:hypothetical protein